MLSSLHRRIIVADRDPERRRWLEKALGSLEGDLEIVGTEPDQVDQAIADLRASHGLLVVLGVETVEDLDLAEEIRAKAPTPRVVVFGLVDPGEDALTRQAYKAGFNACLASGRLDEVVDRVRDAAEFTLDTVAF